MGFIEQMTNCIPCSADAQIPWDRIDQLFAATPFAGMKTTQQNPVFHGEGDVYTHTQMVCGELIRNPAFYELPEMQRTELFLAAILHDIGKVKTTKLEDGEWISPHHAAAGSQIVREFLWEDCGICGTWELAGFRETVCALIRYHMLPFHLMEQTEPERKVRVAAAVGELAADFSWHLLCLLSEADVRGRIADDMENALTQVELARVVAEEAKCLYKPYPFADSFTKRAWFAGRNIQPDQSLYDGTWGEVILLSGLPGTGKDTWIRRNHPGMPVVSLDDLRAQLGIEPTDNQGEVIQASHEQARGYLRRKEPFIWNATNLTKDIRGKLIRLFEQYRARTRIVYLETEWEERKKRNAGRQNVVPENVVEKMVNRIEPPTPEEAHTVEWIMLPAD